MTTDDEIVTTGNDEPKTITGPAGTITMLTSDGKVIDVLSTEPVKLVATPTLAVDVIGALAKAAHRAYLPMLSEVPLDQLHPDEVERWRRVATAVREANEPYHSPSASAYRAALVALHRQRTIADDLIEVANDALRMLTVLMDRGVLPTLTDQDMVVRLVGRLLELKERR